MAQEPEISLTEEQRHCPACGARVAAQATTCLMCGASLIEEEPVAEEEGRRGLPGWANGLIVVVLALAILAAGGFGLYTLLTTEPVEPESVTPSPTPTRTPTATPSPTPTCTPTVTPTPTPIPPLVHQVQEGEVLIDIADAYDTTIEEILALNPELDADVIKPGQLILIPRTASTESSSTPVPDDSTPTPMPSNYIIHVVAQGEVLGTIAEEYGISVEAIRAANDMPFNDDTIQVNQSLVIPIGTPVPSPTPTVDPNATPTPVPPYQPPALLSPRDGATFVGSDETILLQWASVNVLRDDEWYALTLIQPAGGVMSDTTHTRVTSWRVPLDLLPPASAAVREFRWQVQVVRETRDEEGELIYEGAGGPSAVRAFIWLAPTPTPGPTPTSAP